MSRDGSSGGGRSDDGLPTAGRGVSPYSGSSKQQDHHRLLQHVDFDADKYNHWSGGSPEGHGPSQGFGRPTPSLPAQPSTAGHRSVNNNKHHHLDHHHHHHLHHLGSPRQCRVRRSLQSMAYGIMLCTFLWIFLYTLSFSCCVGNSRLESVSPEEYGAAGVAGGTRRLQQQHLHHHHHHHRAVVRELPTGGGGEGPDDGGEGDLPEDGETQEEEEGVNHQEIPPVRVHFLHGRSTNMGIRRVEEDEDDTIYTLPDDTQEDSPPPRSTHTGGGYRYDAAPRRRADGHNDENVGDDDDRASNPADRTDGLFHPRDTRRNFNYQDSSSRRNRQDSAPATGDNTLKSDISDSNNSKSRKYDVGKSPRRRGSGGGRGSKNRYRTDADTRTRQGYSRKLPNGLIIGVKKGGTRALLEFLRVHPDIRAPGPEPHFFDRNYEKGLEWYRSQMPPTLDGQLTLEKTPSYFVTKGVPGRIFNMSRGIKLIVVVRDPVTRAISDYTQSSSKRTDVKAFEQMAFLDNSTGLVDTSWGAIRIGVYAKHLERWLKYFPLSQIHFVSGERLISDPAAELAKVQDFLGLKRVITDKHFYFNSTKGFPCLKKPEGSGNPHCLGKTKGRPHPKVDPKVIKRLHDFYRPFNAKFYQMTNIDFGWP